MLRDETFDSEIGNSKMAIGSRSRSHVPFWFKSRISPTAHQSHQPRVAAMCVCMQPRMPYMSRRLSAMFASVENCEGISFASKIATPKRRNTDLVTLRIRRNLRHRNFRHPSTGLVIIEYYSFIVGTIPGPGGTSSSHTRCHRFDRTVRLLWNAILTSIGI